MKKYYAEFLGTLTLVLVGCGAAVISGAAIGVVGIALAFGFVLVALVYAIGPISGCHVNPAVSVAMFALKKLSVKDTVGYIVAQVLGATAGAGILLLVMQGIVGYDVAQHGLGQNGYGSGSLAGFSLQSAFIAEFVFTAIFLLVILGATSKKAHEKFAGISIGLSLVVIHIVTIPVTGTSVNPARSIGPAIFVGGDALIQLWLFVLAPILGALVAAFLWKMIFDVKRSNA